MKNQIKKISTLTSSMFVVVMLVSGCSKTTVELSPADQIIGKWKWTSVTNISLSKSDFADEQDFQKSFSTAIFEFKTGGVYTLTYGGQTDKLTYTISGNSVSIDGDDFTVSFAGNTMTLSNTEVNLIFTKQ